MMTLRWRLFRYGSAIIMVTLGVFVGYSIYDLFGEAVYYISSHYTPHHMDTASELVNYNRLMNSWKFTGRPHAIIYYAVPSNEDSIYRLKHYSLRRLENHFTDHYQYPVVIFHDSQFPNWHMVDIRLRSSSPVFFQEVNFTTSSYEDGASEVWDKNCFESYEDQRMNMFHMKDVFQHPIFDNLDLYWRMDDASMLYSTTGYDLYNHMKNHKFLYGYTFVVPKENSCVEGLKEITDKFIKDNNIKHSNFNKGFKENDAFYTNFEMSDVKFWQQPMVKKFLNVVKESGNKSQKRWSSDLVHTYAVKLFMSESKIHAFKDIYYEYKGRSTQSLSYYVMFYFFDVCLRLTVVRFAALCVFLYIVRCRRRSLMDRRKDEFQLINSKLV